MKNKLFILLLVFGFISCGNSGSETSQNTNASTIEDTPQKMEDKNEDPRGSKGVGEIKRVSLNDPLNEAMIENGKAIYELKCSACHKLSDKRVVGPGWKGITEKRRPEWIMNMITNVETMLDEDPEAQKLLEECLTRMPNQNVSVEESRDILEFMYFNDKTE